MTSDVGFLSQMFSLTRGNSIKVCKVSNVSSGDFFFFFFGEKRGIWFSLAKMNDGFARLLNKSPQSHFEMSVYKWDWKIGETDVTESKRRCKALPFPQQWG